MNRVYRLIWNHRTGTLVPAAEITHTRGKRSSRSAVVGAIALSAGLGASAAIAAEPPGAIAANTSTNINNSTNGVPVVDIANPNAGGLSHNLYTQYNVDTRGLVLNNSTSTVQSQLAGILEANQNLKSQAGIILNEVVNPNRSQLSGYTEVAGGKADVVIANPWGITCSGCGFINTDRATLTTGTPLLGSNGQLGGFMVQGGDILIQGQGLDASRQNVLDLVARSIKLDGQINGKDVGLTAGANQFDYGQRLATAQAASGTAPSYAIDSTALGGMYVNRIRLTATEAGVGVRMLGTAAASADDFNLTAAGKIELNSKISAQRDLSVSYTGVSAGDAISVQGSGAELSAKQNLALDAGKGDIRLQDGKLTADQLLSLKAVKLNDDASADTTRFGGSALSVLLSSSASINRSTWGSGGQSDWQAGSLMIGSNGASLYAGSNSSAASRVFNMTSIQGDLNLANAQIKAAGDLNLKAAQSLLLGSTGSVQSGEDLLLSVGKELRNLGQFLSQLSLSAYGLSSNLSLRNEGRLQAGTAVQLGSNGRRLNVEQTATGTVLGDSIDAQAGTLSNAGTIQASSGLNLNASGALSNATGAKILNTVAGQPVTITALSVDNAGSVQSAGAATLLVNQKLLNSGTILLAQPGQALAITASDIENTQTGTIQGSGAYRLTASKHIENAGTLLQLRAASASEIAAASINNSGKLESKGTLGLSVSGALTNTSSGTILSTFEGRGVTVNAGRLVNDGGIQSASTLNVTTLADLVNNGKLLTTAADGAITLAAGSLLNGGAIQSSEALSAIVTGSLANSGLLLTTADGKALLITAGSVDNSGTLQANGKIDAKISGTLNNKTGGKILNQTAGSELSVNAGTLNNDGAVSAAGALTLTVAQQLKNIGTLLQNDASQSLTLSAASLDNSGDLQSLGALSATLSGAASNSGNLRTTGSNSSLTLSAASLNNSGVTESADALSLTTSGALQNQSNGKLLTKSSGDTLTLKAGSLDNAGSVQSAGALNATASGDIDNSGTMVTLASASGGSAGALSLSGASVDNLGSGKLDSAGTSSFNASSTVQNLGTIQGSGRIDVSVGTGFSNETSGQILGDGIVAVTGTAASFTLDNNGLVQSGGQLALGSSGHKATLNNTASGKLLGDSLAVVAGTATNAGTLQAKNGGSLSADSLSNNGSSSKIIAATQTGATTFTISGVLSNQGAMHANDDFTITAGSVSNSDTAGLSSLGKLSVEASAGDLSNYGALYSSGNMTLKASGLVVNQTGATINSDAKTSSTSASFKNKGEVVVDSLEINTSSSFQNGLDDSELPTISLDWANVQDSGVNEIKHEKWYCNIAKSACQEFFLYEREITVKEVLSAPLPTIKPQLIATNTISINYGAGTGANNAGVLSAQTLNITGTGTFTNKDFELKEQKYGQRWLDMKFNCTTCDIAWEYFYPKTQQQYDNAPNAGGDDDDYPSWQAGGEWGYLTGEFVNPLTGQTVIDRRRTKGRSPESEFSNQALDASFKKDLGKTTYATSGAGIFAQTLNYSGGTLNNYGATNRNAPSRINGPTAVDPATGQSVSVVSGGQAAGSVSGGSATGSLSASAQAANKINGLSFAGLNLQLPTNPNGFFVVSKDPNSNYLVESNPLFGVNSDFLGSNYFVERYGYNPDTVTRRLGDANYEAYLIRQQLIQQTGSNLIAGLASEADQMKQLMDQAFAQGEALGLSFGKPLSDAQIAGLTQDIVWMEETVVNGQTVLAPRVYLAATTKSQIVQGATIAAANTNINATSVNNTGGTIAGSDKLTIKSQGDVTNTSGTIKGGSVSVTSTQGSVINQTAAEGHGDKLSYETTIGKTAAIQATQDLSIDAAKDIKVLGADISSGGAGSLKAGGEIKVDTIVDKTATSSTSTDSQYLGLQSTTESKTVTSEKNIGSTINIGGALKLDSGGNTTIGGSKLSADSLDAKSGGNFSIEARQDKLTTETTSTVSGIGVGGGVFGASTTKSNDFVGTNSGSTVDIQNNAKVDTAGKLTLQGSDLTIGSDASIKAKQGIEILDGLDERKSTSTTETSTFMKFESSSDSAAASDSNSGSRSAGSGAAASASASASAEASSGLNVKFYQTETSTTNSGKTESVSSNLKVGGNLSAQTDGALKIQGSNVEVGGNADLQAKSIDVLAGRNEEYSNTTTQTTSYGIYNDNSASAEAQAGAATGANGGGAYAKAGASASAKAETTTTIGARTELETSKDYTLTNTGSTIKTGGNLSVKAQDTATFEGAKVSAGGDLSIQAKDIVNKAAQDISESSSSKSTSTTGVYFGAEAEASAGASGQAGAGGYGGGMPARGSANASASAEASVGLRTASEKEGESTTAITNVTNSFTAGGNVTRKAENKIIDQGTSIEAGGDINQSARIIEEQAIHDTVTTTSNSSSLDARIGAYAGASADAGANSNGKASAGADASAGFKASVAGADQTATSETGTAVTSKYKAGGSISSKSTEKTTLVGTQFEAGKDVTIEAGTLDYQAAKDYQKDSSSSHEGEGQIKVGVVGTAGLTAEGSYAGAEDSSSSTKAQAGGISAGGNVTLKTTSGDLSLEGTKVNATGAVDLQSAGNLDIKAARDTSQSSGSSVDASVSLQATAGGGGADASAGYSSNKASSSTATAASIKGGTVNLSGAKDVNLEGTQLKSDGGTSIEAGGNVNLKAATSTSSSQSMSISGEIGGSSEKSSSGTQKTQGSGGMDASMDMQAGASSQAVSVDSGGTLTIKGQTISNQQADLKAADGQQLSGTVINEKKTDYSVEAGASMGMGGGGKETSQSMGGDSSSGAKSSGSPSSSSSSKSGSSGK